MPESFEDLDDLMLHINKLRRIQRDGIRFLSLRYVAITLVAFVGEADKLTFSALEELRAMYDEFKFGLILMGMPGIEKRLFRYAQLYYRIGFAHEFEPIGKEDMKFLFEQKWLELGHQFDNQTFVDVEAITEIIKITHGNFRLINRIFDQMQRIRDINNLTNLTKDLVDAAKNCLVIGDFL